jgi:hypothetical protein
MITVFVGDVTEYLAAAAKQHNINARLITIKNYKKIRPGTYYTSIGDLTTPEKFVSVLEQADTIIYAPPVEIWSSSQTQKQTEYWLTVMRAFEHKKIINIDDLRLPLLDKFLHLADRRTSEGSQVWIAGCSISHGDGVEKSQRYGQLIADQLQQPVAFLTASGSSISWAADQILRSDLRTGDTVVWGLTSMYRKTWFNDNHDVAHINTYWWNPVYMFVKNIKHTSVTLDQLWEQDRAYDAITKIYQVVNFCNKLGVKLYLAGLLVDLRRYSINLSNFVSFYDEIKQNETNQFLDIGTDPQRHPGPLTHQWYADEILKKINQLTN